ncbi:MAG: tetratricopeptide repeat protein, partial [Myxococcota bacterium]|nr:tetratricopeptide repeat protein [Myxococcota bacterium]
GAMDLPESISLWEGVERIARSLGRPEIVARAYHRVLDRHGIDPAIAEVLGRRMVAFEGDCAIGRLPSIAALEAAFSADPTNADCRERLVQNYEDQAEWTDAARVLRVAVNAVDDDRPLFRRLIEAYLRAGSDRDALEALDHAIATRPADADLLSLRAGVRERTSDYEGALSDLEHASLNDSAYVDTLIEMLSRMEGIVDRPDADRDAIRLADALIRLKRPNQARREVDRLLARSPHHVAGLSRIAALASDAGSWDLAVGSYRKLMLIAEKEGSQGDLARFAIAAADACQHAGTFGEAREPLERALGILSQNHEMQLEFERLCRAMKEWPRLACALVERAERAQEEDKADLLVRAARLLLEEGNDPAGALRVLGPVETTKPGSLEAVGVWARAQVAMGHAHRALGALYDAAERNRSKRSPVLASIYLEIGRAHLAVDEVVEAFVALESAFDVDSRTGDVAMLFGLVALDLGDEKTAERALSSVTTLPFLRDARGRGADPGTRAMAFYHLAFLASAKGDLAKARRLVSRALGVDPRNGPARALLATMDSRTIAAAVQGK